MTITDTFTVEAHSGIEMYLDISILGLTDKNFIRSIIIQNNTYNILVNSNITKSSNTEVYVTIANTSNTIFTGKIYPIIIIFYTNS